MALDAVLRVADACLRTQGEDQAQRHWGDAVLIQGMLAVHQQTGRSDYLNYARRWLDAYIEYGFDPQRWVWFWAGLAPPALAIYRASGEERYRAFARRIADALLHGAPRIGVGGITPHADRPELWVDIPFFVCPSLTQVATVEADGRYRDEAVRQLQLHIQHLRDEASGLFYHVWNAETGERSPCLWGRGNGWLAIALLEVLEHLTGRPKEKAAFSATLVRQAASLARLQGQDGLWHTVLDRPDSYTETSCSAMFVGVIARGVRNGYLDRAYLENARRGWQALVSQRVSEDGRVLGISSQTPPGTFDMYNAIPTGSEKFGTGLFLLAGLEMARL